MDHPRISVVLPCFNQGDSLKETLRSLEHQTLPKEQFEVVLVDDGSTDQTWETIEALNAAFPVKYIRQENSGAAAARNRGAEAASAELLLFLDADMICDANLLAAHLQVHQQAKRVIIEGSRRPWRTAASAMYYRVLDVDTNTPARGAQHIFFGEILSCNLSLDKQLFQDIGGFDPQLMRWEDVDFAYRAYQRGVEFRFESQAAAYHHHPMSFEEYCQKQRKLHQIAAELSKKHPGILQQLDYLRDRLEIDRSKDGFPLILRKLIRKFLALPPMLKALEKYVQIMENFWPVRSLLARPYRMIIAGYQLIGLKEGIG